MYIHCFEGKHRSAGIAYVIEAERTSAEEAIEILDLDMHSPNSLVVALAAKVLDLPNLVKVFEDYMAIFTENLRRKREEAEAPHDRQL